MALLKSSSKILLHFSPSSPFSGCINIHTNEEHPKDRTMEYVTRDPCTSPFTCTSNAHCCSLLMGPNQMPSRFEVIYENWAVDAGNVIASSKGIIFQWVTKFVAF